MLFTARSMPNIKKRELSLTQKPWKTYTMQFLIIKVTELMNM